MGRQPIYTHNSRPFPDILYPPKGHCVLRALKQFTLENTQSIDHSRSLDSCTLLQSLSCPGLLFLSRFLLITVLLPPLWTRCVISAADSAAEHPQVCLCKLEITVSWKKKFLIKKIQKWESCVAKFMVTNNRQIFINKVLLLNLTIYVLQCITPTSCSGSLSFWCFKWVVGTKWGSKLINSFINKTSYHYHNKSKLFSSV